MNVRQVNQSETNQPSATIEHFNVVCSESAAWKNVDVTPAAIAALPALRL